MIITSGVLNLQELDSPDAKKILDLERFLEGICKNTTTTGIQSIVLSLFFCGYAELLILLTKDYFIR